MSSPDAAEPDEPRVRFAELIEQARAGSEQAAALLYQRYASKVVRAIRRQFLPPHDPLRRQVDSTDLAQEAWLALLAELKDGRTFPDQQAFLHFLLALTANCCRNNLRGRRAQERDPGREVPLAAGEAVPDREPGPDVLAEAADEWRLRLDAMRPVPRRVFQLLLGGCQPEGIAEQLRLSPLYVERIIGHQRQRWGAT